jgi:hypothetical protein
MVLLFDKTLPGLTDFLLLSRKIGVSIIVRKLKSSILEKNQSLKL